MVKFLTEGKIVEISIEFLTKIPLEEFMTKQCAGRRVNSTRKLFSNGKLMSEIFFEIFLKF